MSQQSTTELPVHVTFSDVFDRQWQDMLFWSIVFFFIYAGFLPLVKFLFPTAYARVPERKRRDFRQYLGALPHHSLSAVLSLLRICGLLGYDLGLDLLSSSFLMTMTKDSSVLAAIATNKTFLNLMHCDPLAFSFGYVVNDTFFWVIPDYLENGTITYLLHHGIAFAILFIVPFLDENMAVYCSRTSVMELSSIFFTSAWLLRNLRDKSKDGQGTSKKGAEGNNGDASTKFILWMVTVNEYLFSTAFFLTRVVNLFFILFDWVSSLYASYMEGRDFDLVVGGCVLFFFLAWCMQLFWFSKIVSSLAGRAAGRKGGKHKKAE